MIEKVLIAEDHESANISLQKTLEEAGIMHIDYVYYCDDAFSRIQLHSQTNKPYDLLITDLYFEVDLQKQQITDGIALIDAVRQEQPDLRILVFSAESKAGVIEMLFNKQQIDGFVRKARNDVKELKLALSKIAVNQRYFPRHLALLIQQKNSHAFTLFDITIINLLAQGTRQKDIPAYLEKNLIRPSGLSSVEKRLNLIKEALQFSKNEQLVAYCKDMGII